jgi:hypothetical protein
MGRSPYPSGAAAIECAVVGCGRVREGDNSTVKRAFLFGLGSSLIIGVIGAAAALAVVAAVLIWHSDWNPFLPKDYEECIESAAKSAKSKEALNILTSSCGSRFVGRRNGRRGYVYFDGRQNRSFDIAGPNPTSDEWASVDKAYNQHLADVAKNDEIQRLELAEQQRQQYEEYQRAVNEQAERTRKLQQVQAEQDRKQQQVQADLERRRQAALSRIAVTSYSVDCVYQSLPGCPSYKVTATIRNQSTETISMLAVGWVFFPEGEINCPTYVQMKHQEGVRLRPGDSLVMNVDGRDGPGSRAFRYCVVVLRAATTINS